MTVLSTDRTRIDKICLTDAAFFVELVNTPDWLRFIGDRGVSDVESAEQYLRSGFLQCYREHGFGYYLVRNCGGNAMGICGFLKKPQLANADFGFAFLPEYTQRGFASEAAEAILSYGVERYQFSELDAVASADNIRSHRLLEKLGFIAIGRIALNDTDLLCHFRWSKASAGTGA